MINIAAPLVGLLILSLTVAFLVSRKTRKTWAGALAGGSVIPLAWLIDGAIWLNNMAVDDPPPGMIMLGLAIGIPVAVAICFAGCFLTLRIFAGRK